jgi:hypothetical protein
MVDRMVRLEFELKSPIRNVGRKLKKQDKIVIFTHCSRSNLIMGKFEFDGKSYNDDRMFVSYVCPCAIQGNKRNFRTTIYHEQPPPKHNWCVVIYRNTERFLAHDVKHFHTESEAKTFRDQIEPATPRISLGGQGADPLPSLEQYRKWKLRNGCEEYDYRRMFLADSVNPTETITTPKPKQSRMNT